jgi:hypothetical protein
MVRRVQAVIVSKSGSWAVGTESDEEMTSPDQRPAHGEQSLLLAIEPAGRLADLLVYWRGLVTGRLPGRADIDPLDIGASLLPHVFLADVLEGGGRFRWRLIGTHIVTHALTDDTGKDFEVSIAPAMRATIIEHYRKVVISRRPLCHRGSFTGRDGRGYRYDRLLLPLAADGMTVDMILGGAVFDQIAVREA